VGRHRIWIPESISPVTESIVDLPPIRLSGRYTVDLIEAKTGKVKQHLEFPNLITDAGLNFIGSGTKLDDLYTTFAVGTGTTPPAVTDTALESSIATTTNDEGATDLDTTQSSPREYSSRKRTRVFLETEANGDLTELGWVYGGLAVNRSLFKDVAGNVTTVYKTNNDILKVVYEYKIFAPQGDVSGTFDLGAGSGSTSYIIRPQNVNNALGWGALRTSMGDYSTPFAKVHETMALGSRTGDNDPSPSDEESSNTFTTYVTGSFYRDMEYVWTYPDANFSTGISLITWNPWYASGDRAIWQMFLSSSVEKTNLNKFTIKFRQSWDRV